MTENPVSGATPSESQLQTSQPDVPVNEGTGNPADAAPTQANPSDSSGVSDADGVQSLAEQEAAQQEKRDQVAEANAEHQERVDVDHEGTGPGNGELPPSDYTESDDADTE